MGAVKEGATTGAWYGTDGRKRPGSPGEGGVLRRKTAIQLFWRPSLAEVDDAESVAAHQGRPMRRDERNLSPGMAGHGGRQN